MKIGTSRLAGLASAARVSGRGRKLGLADHDTARLLEPAHEGRVHLGHPMLEDGGWPASPCCRTIGGIDAMKRAPRPAA